MSDNSQSRYSRREQPKKNNSNGKSPKIKKKRTVGSVILKIFLGLVALGVIGVLAGAGLFWSYAKDAPKISDTELDATVSSKFYTMKDELFEDIGAENRVKVEPNQVPQLLTDAIVSVEDRRFYQHKGVDPIRIIGSAVSNVKTGGLQGGSTLTQQLIKLSYFSTKTEDQTIKRKAQEAWMALELEKEKSKQEIITYYINKVYMANGFYGMETAAENYFDKTLDQLSLAQTALLAGMPQAPNDYDPYTQPEYAKQRRDIVLGTMLDNKKISKAEHDEAVATPIDDGLQKLGKENSNRKIVDNYLFEAIKEVKEKTGKDVYTDGLKIYTNIDLDAQKKLYDIVNTEDYVDYPDDKFQVASTLIDVKTGEVRAQIGARKVADGTVFGFNAAVETGRDFGSTMKPITDYGPAFEYLDKSTGDMISDQPYNYEGTNTPVKNWDNQYFGNITLRSALYNSRNVPAIKLFNEVGEKNVTTFLNKLGINYKTIHQSNAISSNTEEQDGTKYGASTLKMAAAYAAIANGGTYYKPQYVNKVVYQNGTEDEFPADGERAMKETTAYMLTDILKDTIAIGSGTNAQIEGLYQAGKTGTSNYTDDELAKLNTSSGVYPDILFAGYTRNYALSVWTGYNHRMTPVTDETNMIASDVYREFMRYVSASVTNTDWEMPKGLTRIGNELYLEGKYTAPSSSYTPPVTSETTETFSSESESSTSEEPASSTSEVPSSSSTESTPPPETTETGTIDQGGGNNPPAESGTEPNTEPSTTDQGNNNKNG
ncbi:penicillin-binding protein 1A [Enterococcus sp. AZ194]|uniref:PBP1A family penicillin-binding protein n=1 Tax=Enterococcus sp. AZ194 TaxID=2774629 RepID=UPI003F270FF9